MTHSRPLTCPGDLPVSQLEPALAAWAQMGAGGGDLLADASRRGVVDTAVLDVARGARRIVCVGGLVWSVRAHAIEARVVVNLTLALTHRVAMARRRRPRVDRCHAGRRPWRSRDVTPGAGPGGREPVARRG